MKSNKYNAGMFALSLGALGVVFGDIGTSPLYAIREIFSIGNNILELNEANMLGILSLILWSLLSIVSFKYIHYILKANNNGKTKEEFCNVFHKIIFYLISNLNYLLERLMSYKSTHI